MSFSLPKITPHHGTGRLVLESDAFPGLVMKIAKSPEQDKIDLLRKNVQYAVDHNSMELVDSIMTADASLGFSPEGLIRGFRENMLEALMPQDFHHLVVPTRRTIAYYVNFQELAQPTGLSKKQVSQLTDEYLGERNIQDIHSLHNPANYGWHEGRVKFVDYGGPRVNRAIQEVPERVAEMLDAMEVEAKRLQKSSDGS